MGCADLVGAGDATRAARTRRTTGECGAKSGTEPGGDSRTGRAGSESCGRRSVACRTERSKRRQ